MAAENNNSLNDMFKNFNSNVQKAQDRASNLKLKADDSDLNKKIDHANKELEKLQKKAEIPITAKDDKIQKQVEEAKKKAEETKKVTKETAQETINIANAWKTVHEAIKHTDIEKAGKKTAQKTKTDIDNIINSIERLNNAEQQTPYNTKKMLNNIKEELEVMQDLKQRGVALDHYGALSISNKDYTLEDYENQLKKIAQIEKSITSFGSKSSSNKYLTQINKVLKGTMDSVNVSSTTKAAESFDKIGNSAQKATEKVNETKQKIQDIGLVAEEHIGLQDFEKLIHISDEVKKELGGVYDVYLQIKKGEEGAYNVAYKLVGLNKNQMWVGLNNGVLSKNQQISFAATNLKAMDKNKDIAGNALLKEQIKLYQELHKVQLKKESSTGKALTDELTRQENELKLQLADVLLGIRYLGDEEVQQKAIRDRLAEKVKFQQKYNNLVNENKAREKQRDIDQKIGQETQMQVEAYSKLLSLEKEIAKTTNAEEKLQLEKQRDQELNRIITSLEKANKLEQESTKTHNKPFRLSENGNLVVSDPKIQARAQRNAEENRYIKNKTKEDADALALDNKRKETEAQITKEINRQIDAFNKMLSYNQKAASAKNEKEELLYLEMMQKEWDRIAKSQDKILQKQQSVQGITTTLPFSKGRNGAISVRDENLQTKFDRVNGEIARISILKEEERENKTLEAQREKQKQDAINLLNLEKQRIEADREREKVLEEETKIRMALRKAEEKRTTDANKARDQEINRQRKDASARKAEKEVTTQNAIKANLEEQKAIYQEIQNKRIEINKNRLLQDEEQVKSLETEKTNLVKRLLESEKRLKLLDPNYSRSTAGIDFSKMKNAADQTIANNTESFVNSQLNKQLSIYKEIQQTRLNLQKPENIDNSYMQLRLNLLKEQFKVRENILKEIDEERYKEFRNNELTNVALKTLETMHQIRQKNQQQQDVANAKTQSVADQNFTKATAEQLQLVVQKTKELWQLREKMSRAKNSDEYQNYVKQDEKLSNIVAYETERLKLFGDQRAMLIAENNELEQREKFLNSLGINSSTQNKIAALGNNANKFQLGTAGMIGRYEGVDSWINQLNDSINRINKLQGKVKELETMPWNQRVEAEARLNDQYEIEKQKLNEIKAAINGIKRDPSTKYVDKTTISKQIASMEEFYSKNDGASKRMRDQMRSVIDKVVKLGEAGKTLPKDFDPLVVKFEQIKATMKKTGDTGMSIMSKLGRAWKSQMASQIAMYTSFYSLIRYAKNAFNTIRELDTAMVDLSKTTKMSASEMNQFYYDANEAAKEYGVTTKELIEQASAWSRLGFNTKEQSTEMAKMSSQFAMISPGMSTEESQQGLISTMKAFGIEVDDVKNRIMDSINVLGNNFAESNKDIVDGMQRSSAALAAVGTSFEDAAALFTGGK